MNGMSFELVVSQQVLSARTQPMPLLRRQQSDGMYHKPPDISAPTPKDYSLRAVELLEPRNPLQAYGSRKEEMHTPRVDYSPLESHLYVRDNSVASYSPSSGYSPALFGLPSSFYGIAPDMRYS